MDTFQLSLTLATLLCSLVTGFVFAFAVVAMPGIGTLDDREFLRAVQAMDGVIPKNQPIFIVVWVGSVVTLGSRRPSVFADEPEEETGLLPSHRLEADLVDDQQLGPPRRMEGFRGGLRSRGKVPAPQLFGDRLGEAPAEPLYGERRDRGVDESWCGAFLPAIGARMHASADDT